MVGGQGMGAPGLQAACCKVQGLHGARRACWQLPQLRQDRKWFCEAIVRLPQHPTWPMYGDKPVWSLPTSGLWCGSPSVSKPHSTPNRSTWRIQGTDINLTQPLEHPQAFYSLRWPLPEKNSCELLFLMIGKFFAFYFPSWFTQEVIQQVSVPAPWKGADVLMTQHWMAEEGLLTKAVLNRAITGGAAAICMQQSYLLPVR